ncbi:MAG: NYN domain-containing protein [Hyphomonadaceae bacterium JAD_PAG50586_4]|nr:MAG: NYN domain-containing protein [Hyphomonadaceae bacterium JAD_PAG50586_4]
MKTVVLIDGGHLRACTKVAGKKYDNALIVAFAALCTVAPEYLLRVFYYDSPQFEGTIPLPVSGGKTEFKSNDHWLRELAQNERFAVRRGTIGFRGWVPKKIPISGKALTDADFKPSFEQKGVDMRIGLDIASFCDGHPVERVVLVSADTDMIPAMKHARKAGLEVVIIRIGATKLHDNLLAHADLVRAVALP